LDVVGGDGAVLFTRGRTVEANEQCAMNSTG
jgi:hypothetical protein